MHVVYESESPGGVYYHVGHAGGWSEPETITSAANAAYPTMVLSGATPIVAWSTIDPSVDTLYTATRSSGVWGSVQTLSGYSRPDLMISGSTQYLTSSVLGRSAAPSFVQLWSRSSTSSAWGAGSLHSVSSWAFSRLGASSGPAVLVADSTGLTLRSGAASVTVNGAPVEASDAATGPDGKTHVVYAPADDHIVYYIRYSAGLVLESAWIIEEPGTSATGSQWISGLRIAVGSRIVVSYLDHSRGSVLRVAISQGADWTRETVAQADDVLGDTSLALEDGWTPHVIYPAPSSWYWDVGYAVLQ